MYKSRAPSQLAQDRTADAICELPAKISHGTLLQRGAIRRRGRLFELLLFASRAAATFSTPWATLISKTRSCDHLKALGHSYQQDPKLRLSQRFGPLLSERPDAAVRCLLVDGCWLVVGCCLLLCCVLFVVCLVLVFFLCLPER